MHRFHSFLCRLPEPDIKSYLVRPTVSLTHIPHKLIPLAMARHTKPISTPVEQTKPKKQVKFLIPSESPLPISLSPVPNTPSPAYSQSSLPSTTGPYTPPTPTIPPPPHAFSPVKKSPVVPHLNSPHFVPATPTSPAPPSLHDLLANPQGVRLDVAFPPHPDRLRIHLSHLSMAATHPPARVMKVVAAGLPWSIVVEPITTSSPFVTVLDVLHALYTSLHKPIKQAEFDAVSQSYRDLISKAWHHRLDKNTSPSDVKAERARGVRRMDYLLGKTCIKRLRYLSISGQGEVTWLVDFGT